MSSQPAVTAQNCTPNNKARTEALHSFNAWNLQPVQLKDMLLELGRRGTDSSGRKAGMWTLRTPTVAISFGLAPKRDLK